MKYVSVIAYICLLSICGCIQSVFAQDLHFSQFSETPLLRNPSLAGLFTGDVRVHSVYRNQWGSISYPFQTGTVTGAYKFAAGKGDDFFTAGLQLMFDRAGTVALTSTHFLPAFNFHKSLSSSRSTYLSIGFMGGLVSRRLDRSKVTTNNQFDGFRYNGSLPDGETFFNNYSYLDATVGMSMSTTLGLNEEHTFYAGIAYHHLTKPSSGFYTNIQHLPKWVLSGGLKYAIGYNRFLTFHGDYYRQGSSQTLIAGAMYTIPLDDADKPVYQFHAGGMYRYKDALIPMIRMDVQQLSIGFSYDVNISQLRTASYGRGGVETSLSYLTFINSQKSSYDKVKCPRF